MKIRKSDRGHEIKLTIAIDVVCGVPHVVFVVADQVTEELVIGVTLGLGEAGVLLLAG